MILLLFGIWNAVFMMTRLMTLPQNHMINCFRIYYRELCEIVFILSLTIATSPSVRISSPVWVYIPYNWENKNIQKMKLFLFLAASALAQDVDVCKTNCESRHEAELARCNGDERCINHANDMFRRCLHDCDNGGEGPPSCTDNCDRRLQEGSTVFRKRCHYEISSEKPKNAFVSWQSQYILAFYCPD